MKQIQKNGMLPKVQKTSRTRVLNDFIPYPKARAILATKLNATPHEIAAWVFDGPEHGGLAAFLSANELDPPPRFYFDSYINMGDYNYLKPLEACWFKLKDIENFNLQEHYLTGKQLIERWQQYSEVGPENYIRILISQSRLIDGHPITGLTQGTVPEATYLPPLEEALFELSYIEAIELTDFGPQQTEVPKKAPGHLNFDPELQRKADEIAAKFLAERKRHPSKDEVAKILATQVDIERETIARRIRSNWKHSHKPSAASRITLK